MKKILSGSLIVLMVIVVAGPALAEPYHTSTGVVADSSDSKVLVITWVDHPSAPDQAFLIAKDTQVLGPEGQRLPITALQAGDYVREECTLRPDGKREVRRITVLAPSTGFGF